MSDHQHLDKAHGLGAPGHRITTDAVRVFLKHTGRGPTKAHASINDHIVVIVMEKVLSQPELSLASRGNKSDVARMRRAYQDVMRDELVELVERGLDRKVAAFVGIDTVEADVAVEVFLLEEGNE